MAEDRPRIISDLTGWAVLYQRPDGWWMAGDGFETRGAALQAVNEQMAEHVPVFVTYRADVEGLLCEEALDSLSREEEK